MDGGRSGAGAPSGDGGTTPADAGAGAEISPAAPSGRQAASEGGAPVPERPPGREVARKGAPAPEKVGSQVGSHAAPRPAPIVAITSHADGQRVIGGRSVVLEGTLSARERIASVTVSHDGAIHPAEFTQTTFRLRLDLATGRNAIAVTARDEAGGTGTASVSLHLAILSLRTFQPAAIVIGQKDFVNRQQGAPPGPGTLRQPYGSPAAYRGTLYLPDLGNNRILGFRRFPTMNGAAADFVLGQAGFGEDAFGSGRDRMRAPLTVRAFGGKLFAVDHFNHRVLIWNEAPTGNAPADVVIGQGEFGAGASGSCAADRLYVPMSLYVIAGKLLVSDSHHDRILVWDTIPSRSGAPADLVLGQPDLTTCSGDGGAPSARTLHRPGDLWSDGTRLVVADQQNHRVLVWNALPTRNQAPADVVLGQAGMDARAADTTAGTLRRPMFVTVSEGQLFVSDHENNRVLVWDRLPAASGTPADAVLGQGDFTHGARNDDDQDGRPDAYPNARTLSGPAGLLVTAQGLLVADEGNDRVLLFKAR